MDMPDTLLPLCATCARYRGVVPGVGMACDAYRGGIPVEITANVVDHREPFEGDRGFTYKPFRLAGDAFEESKHPRDEWGKFAAHIEGGHAAAMRHGFTTLREPEWAKEDLQGTAPLNRSGGHTIYEKRVGPDRYLLRFYTKHDWPEPQGPFWYNERNGQMIGIGPRHEGLEQHLADMERAKPLFSREDRSAA